MRMSIWSNNSRINDVVVGSGGVVAMVGGSSASVGGSTLAGLVTVVGPAVVGPAGVVVCVVGLRVLARVAASVGVAMAAAVAADRAAALNMDRVVMLLPVKLW